MHSDRGIVRTKKLSGGLSIRRYDPITRTCKSTSTNNAPRDPFIDRTAWNPFHFMFLRICLYLQSRKMSQSPQKLCCCVKILYIVLSVIWSNPCRWYCQFCAGWWLWLYSTYWSKLYLTHWFQVHLAHRPQLDLTCRFQIYSTCWLRLDCTHSF